MGGSWKGMGFVNFKKLSENDSIRFNEIKKATPMVIGLYNGKKSPKRNNE